MTCRRWNWRQAHRTRLREDTTTALFILDALDPTTTAALFAAAPLVLPAHFTLAGDEVLLHLARPNPVWPHLEATAQVRLAVVGDYAYVPPYRRPAPPWALAVVAMPSVQIASGSVINRRPADLDV